MSQKKKASRIRRFLGFIAFRLVPLLLIVFIIWLSSDVVLAVARQFDERSDIRSRQDEFPGTATRIAIVPPTEIPPTATATETDTPTSSPTVTEIPATATSVPPTSTAIPPTATDTIAPMASDTAVPTNTTAPTETHTIMPSATEEPVLVAAQFSTNTPRPLVFATNTPDGSGMVFSTSTPIPTATATFTATFTPTVTPTFTLTPTPTLTPTITPTLTETPRPLPTVLFAPSVEDGSFPTSVPLVPRNYNLTNILLLGGDDELTSDSSVRTDSMIVVSINRDTGTVSMMSLPRDLYVYIPNGEMNRLNVAYTIGDVIGWTGGGFGLMRQTILYNFGINVHYYVRVNFSGFKELIDTLGGVDIAVDCAYQDYGLIGAEVPEGAEEFGDEGLHTLDVGYYHMDGAQALWYARTRRNSSDFDRGRRQQQLLRAIWHRAKDVVSLTNAATLWNQGMDVIETDLAFDDFFSLLPTVLSLDVAQIESYTLIYTYHTTPWQTAAGDSVQLPNYETMRPLLEDFYMPPSDSRLSLSGATIAVYNGTSNEFWDYVAVERLAWDGFMAYAAGPAENVEYSDSVIIDYTGQQKGSNLYEIAATLNILPENIIIDPQADRVADYGVFLGANYDSCPDGVLPVDE
jgi:polyisoprenyl-teichoic acid--peptidoglycan teichoic acid transferase